MDKFAIFKNSRLAFWLACVAALAIVFVSEYSYRKAVQSLDELGTLGQARVRIQHLERGLLDAETGQRGYLLTGRKEYLEQYEKSVSATKEVLQRLDQHFVDAPEAKKLLGELHKLTGSKFSELALTTRLYDEGKAGAATEMLLSGIGREQMIDTLAVSDELLQHESARVAEGRKNVYNTLLISRIGLASLCALGMLAILKYLRQSSALLQQQLEQQRLVQSERDRLEIEVSRRTATLTELTRHLQTAREDERKRLARDLHDELGALLTSAKLDVARIKPRLIGAEPAALALLTHLVETLNRCVALKRSIIEGLQPSSLSHLGLVATLDILAREFAEQSGVEVHCELAPVKLESTAELVIYRVVQETITNVAKYAHAHNVWITLGARDGYVYLSVRDDGIGFDTETQPSSAHGLTGMRFRVEAEGGSLAIESTLGKGTSIQVALPESTNAAPQE
ncbi:MAG: CHASE3 domain-containing protein [Rhodoferax sp.]|uniref:CHASE3 domain-containing protein n=1 Tax=Rhodoferax sp. TaxID=50421 RepID=UPI0027289090|nr:CHASE3 domain-containing protein [Rhodoferax sp.]MDO8449619.1 CHASE3 domain-containing protein [Rhodoferax sp.]